MYLLILIFLLYDLIHLSPLALLTYSLADVSLLQFRLPSASAPPIFGPHVPSRYWSDKERVYFRWLNNVKFSEIKLTFPWESNVHNIHKKYLICSQKYKHKLVNTNVKPNFQISGPPNRLEAVMSGESGRKREG